MKTKEEQIADMNRANGEALQRIGTALDLAPGSNIHQESVKRINAMQARSNVLRAMIGLALSEWEAGDIDAAKQVLEAALGITPEEIMANLEAEYDELERRQMTPTMEMIIQAVHDEAGRCDGELVSPIFIRVDPHDYDALCDEERAREAMLSGSNAGLTRDDEYAPPESDPEWP